MKDLPQKPTLLSILCGQQVTARQRVAHLRRHLSLVQPCCSGAISSRVLTLLHCFVAKDRYLVYFCLDTNTVSSSAAVAWMMDHIRLAELLYATWSIAAFASTPR